MPNTNNVPAFHNMTVDAFLTYSFWRKESDQKERGRLMHSIDKWVKQKQVYLRDNNHTTYLYIRLLTENIVDVFFTSSLWKKEDKQHEWLHPNDWWWKFRLMFPLITYHPDFLRRKIKVEKDTWTNINQLRREKEKCTRELCLVHNMMQSCAFCNERTLLWNGGCIHNICVLVSKHSILMQNHLTCDRQTCSILISRTKRKFRKSRTRVYSCAASASSTWNRRTLRKTIHNTTQVLLVTLHRALHHIVNQDLERNQED